MAADTHRPEDTAAQKRAAEELRRHAEEIIDRLSASPPDTHSAEDTVALLHELAVHQIELDMQNDELRTAQLELDDQRARYFDLFNLAPVGYLTLDDKEVVVEANSTAAILLGIGIHRLVGQPLSAFVHEEDRDQLYLHLRAITTSGTAHDCDMRLKRGAPGDGAEVGHFWAHLESRPQHAGAHSDAQTWITFTDIEELVTEREALKQSESRFASLFEQAPMGYQSLDEDGRFLDVNEMWLSTLGYTHDEVIGRWFGEFLAPEYVDAFRERFPKFKELGAIHSEFEMMHKDGGRRTVAFEGRIGHNPDGSFQKTHCILSDITERRRAELAARRSNQQHRAILETALDGFWLVDQAGRLLEVNESYSAMSGYTQAELVGMNVTDLDAGESTVEGALHLGHAEQQVADRFDTVHRRKDGSTYDVEVSVQYRSQTDGGTVVFLRNISERKRLRLALQHRLVALTQPPTEETQLEFSDVFEMEQIQAIQDAFSDATGVASLIVDLKGRPITEPSNFRRLCGEVVRGTELGLSRCKISDADLAELNESGPSVRPCLSCGLWDASASISAGGVHLANWLVGQVRNEHQSEEAMVAYAVEIGADVDDFMRAFAEVPTMSSEQFERVARSLFTLAQQLSTIAYQNVQQARFITEREAIRNQLADREEQLRFAQSVAHVGNWVWDIQSNELEWSDEMYRIFAVPKSEFPGSLSDVLTRAIHPDDRAAVEESNRDVAEKGLTRPMEYRIVHPDGSIRVVWAEAGRLETDAEGNPVRLTGIVADITDRKKAENALRERTEDLERSNAELQRFAYVASHDLREPLRMVTSYTQLLKKRYAGKLDADADDFIGYAVDGAARMESLIEDLLAYSRVGSQGRAPSEADLGPVLDGVLKGLEVAIADSAATVTSDELPTVVCDPTQIGQVFQNLIANAMKFRRDEPVRIHVGVERVGTEWVFSVADNGLGIEPEYFDRIFVIFQRLQSREDYAGSGMGLAICKRIVERHHGRIWVESEPGEGSMFYFTIPA